MLSQKNSKIPKKTCSFRISYDNMLWLQERAEAERRTLSNMLDLLIDDMRSAEEYIDAMKEEITR